MTLYQNSEMTPAEFKLPLLEGTKAVSIGLTDIDGGWVNLKIKVGDQTHFIHCSFVYDPFFDIRDLFIKVLNGFNHSIEIDEEGDSTILWIDREPNSLVARLMVWKPEDDETKPDYIINETIDVAQFLNELFVRITAFWDANLTDSVLMADWIGVECDETNIDEETHQKIRSYYKNVNLNDFSLSLHAIAGESNFIDKNSMQHNSVKFWTEIQNKYIERREKYVPENQKEMYMVFWETLVSQGNGSRGYFTAEVTSIKTIQDMDNFTKEIKNIVDQMAVKSNVHGIPAISNISKIR